MKAISYWRRRLFLMDEAIQKSKREKADGWKACPATVSDYNFLERR